MAERARARALQRWLVQERRHRDASEAAYRQTSVESAGRSDALYLASYLVDSSAELAELVGLEDSTVRGLILKSAVRERDMEVYRAAFKALGLPLPEREYGRKLARKLRVHVERAGQRNWPETQQASVIEGVALAEHRLSGSS